MNDQSQSDNTEPEFPRPPDDVVAEPFQRAAVAALPTSAPDEPQALPSFELTVVARDQLEQTDDSGNEASIPGWLGVTTIPDRGLDLQRFEPRVRYRGEDLDPVMVFGSDERRIYDDFRYPWGCICRVVTSSGTGTGVIIGPRQVLTASHVVNWSVPGGVNGVVEVHRAGPRVRTTSVIRRVFAFTRVTGSVGWSELDEDYAVLEVADPVGEWYGFLGTKTYSSSWDRRTFWTNLGYPGDVGGAMWPTRQFSKWLDEHAWDFGAGRAMDTNADINPGNSGGPMFGWWDGAPYVVAVVSAHNLRKRENYCAGGSDLNRIVRVAREGG